MKFTDEEELVIFTIRVVCSAFSFLGSLFIIVVYFSLPLCRQNQAFRVILYLSISDLLFSVGMFLGRDATGTLCYFQAAFTSLFGVSTVLWTVMISTRAFIDMRGRVSGKTQRALTDWQMAATCFCVSAVLAVLPFTTDSYGEKIEWCWISEEKGKVTAIVWQVVQFYGLLWTVFAVNLYCVLRVRYMYLGYLKDFDNPSEVIKEEMKRIQYQLWYPFVLLVCWIFGTISQIYTFAEGQNRTVAYVFAILHFSFGSLQGFGNAMVYGFNAEVKAELKSKLCKVEAASLDRQLIGAE